MRLSASCPTPSQEGQALTLWCASLGKLAYAEASPPYPLVVGHSLSDSSSETSSAAVTLPIAMLLLAERLASLKYTVLPTYFNVNL